MSEHLISWNVANNIIKKAFSDKNPVKKYFFITYGPPASGKGSILKNILNSHNIDQNSIITVDIDQYY